MVPWALPVNRVQMVVVHNFQVALVGLWIVGHSRVEVLIAAKPMGSIWVRWRSACVRRKQPVWSEISARVVICRYIQHALICSSCRVLRPSSLIASMR